jgi:hypothetical protein
MPFTLSHPAAVVPLTKRGLVLSALVVGSLTPDLPYFVPMLHQDGFSHTPMGILLFCLPAGLAALGLFHYLIKDPLLTLLPRAHQQRLYPAAQGFSFGPLRRFGLILLSLLLGIGSHILWDAFTHPQAWMVQRFAILRLPVLIVGSETLQVYKVLQHGSSLVGALLLCCWYFEWYRHAHPVTVPANLVRSEAAKLGIIFGIGLLACLAGGLSGLLRVSWNPGLQYFYRLTGEVVISGMTTGIAELLIFSAFWQLHNARKKNAIQRSQV